jgi:signal transduction histidine kinase
VSNSLSEWAVDEPRLSEFEVRRQQRLRHDLRQSLGAVMSLVAIVEHDLTRAPEVLRRLDQIRTETEWMSTLVASAGPRAEDLQVVDVGEVASEVWNSAAATGRCTLQLVRDAAAFAVVDPVDLSRSLRNLVDNAVRAAGPGGRVVVQVGTEGDEVVVVVRDSGPGFGNVATQEGLGLVTVRRFVAGSGGRLEVGRSSLGGAKLVLRLPRVMVTTEAELGGLACES